MDKIRTGLAAYGMSGNGTPIRTLNAEEAQAESIETPDKGIYLLVIKTDKGTQVRKIAATK